MSDARQLQRYRERYGELPAEFADLPQYRGRITVHNDFFLPDGFTLSKHAEVRVHTAEASLYNEFPRDYDPHICVTTRYSRDIGWAEITANSAGYVSSRIRNGTLFLRESR